MATIEIRRQFFASISANFIGFGFGWANAWANVNFLELQSPNSKLQLTYDEISLVMSLICAGGLIGNLTYLWALEKFGRKKPILFLSVPTVVSTKKINKQQIEQIHFFTLTAKLDVNRFRKECILAVCITSVGKTVLIITYLLIIILLDNYMNEYIFNVSLMIKNILFAQYANSVDLSVEHFLFLFLFSYQKFAQTGMKSMKR